MNMQPVLNSFFKFDYKTNPVTNSGPVGLVFVLGGADSRELLRQQNQIVEQYALKYQKKSLLLSDQRQLMFQSEQGPVWILKFESTTRSLTPTSTHRGLIDESKYAWLRDQAGSLITYCRQQKIEKLEVTFFNPSQEIVRPCVIGFELATYNFLSMYGHAKSKLNLKCSLLVKEMARSFNLNILKDWVAQAQTEAQSIQLARHLVNLPPNEINPDGYENFIIKNMKLPKTMQITVWNEKKLRAENMNLICAVGQGASSAPRMIHLKYRPKKSTLQKPIAFIGKGITFDTGGLDIKPSSAMRLMKKDMGGSAAVLGLAYWVAHSNYPRACDFYLALAENAVSGQSMRPSDLYRSRAGHLVEIDNTDAEGRLVLADVMDVAATKKGKDEPEILIDIATLTGAIKVALGTEIAGLFTNNDELADQLTHAGQRAGDLNWRMPLHSKYWGSMNSSFADFKNSGESFGGAITAALFLEKFCAGKKWAHLDVYSWVDKPQGALAAVGGSGQPVQALIEWLKCL